MDADTADGGPDAPDVPGKSAPDVSGGSDVPDAPDGADASGIVGRAAAAVAWVVGVALLLVGISSLASGGGALPFVLGLIVTPRTRAELVELCAIVAAGRERE